MTNLMKALALMNALIDAGAEFPDACYKASAKFEVPYEDVADAYDAQNADESIVNPCWK